MTSTPLPLLYSYRRCPYAMRARMALLVAGIAFDAHDIVLRDKPAAMLALSPKGTVPVLVLPDGTVLEQSLDIMQWAWHQHDPAGWWARAQDAANLELLAVCDGGRILNPLSARSQVIGAMVMAAGAALMEELVVDKRFGLFINHDLAGYEVPVHADIGKQDVIFLDTLDPIISPIKAKGVGELGICGPGAAIANAIHNATGVRVREYPITLEKVIGGLPDIA